MTVWGVLKADYRAVGGGQRVGSFIYPRFTMVALHRLGNGLWRHHLKPLALVVAAVNQTLTGADVHPAATIGPGFDPKHTPGIVIGDKVTIGAECAILQGVTLGLVNWRKDGPRIGDGVFLGVSSLVLGPVHIGDRARIGAGSIILEDVPAGVTIRARATPRD